MGEVGLGDATLKASTVQLGFASFFGPTNWAVPNFKRTLNNVFLGHTVSWLCISRPEDHSLASFGFALPIDCLGGCNV